MATARPGSDALCRLFFLRLRVMLSVLVLPLAIFSPQGPGCVSDACGFRRDGFAGTLAGWGAVSPRELWSVPGGNESSCSGDGEQVICSEWTGSSAYNASGRVWHASFGAVTPSAKPQPPFLAPKEGVGGSIGGVLEACASGSAPGCRMVTLRSMDLGGVYFADELTSGATVIGESLGPWVLPRVQQLSGANGSLEDAALKDPSGSDGLLVVARGDGLVMAYNVELALCWATRFLCLQPEARLPDACRTQTLKPRPLTAPHTLRPLLPSPTPSGRCLYPPAAAHVDPRSATSATPQRRLGWRCWARRRCSRAEAVVTFSRKQRRWAAAPVAIRCPRARAPLRTIKWTLPPRYESPREVDWLPWYVHRCTHAHPLESPYPNPTTRLPLL
eukprot:7378418-Prymnesium_polylepis.1